MSFEDSVSHFEIPKSQKTTKATPITCRARTFCFNTRDWAPSKSKSDAAASGEGLSGAVATRTTSLVGHTGPRARARDRFRFSSSDSEGHFALGPPCSSCSGSGSGLRARDFPVERPPPGPYINLNLNLMGISHFHFPDSGHQVWASSGPVGVHFPSISPVLPLLSYSLIRSGCKWFH